VDAGGVDGGFAVRRMRPRPQLLLSSAPDRIEPDVGLE
jgi:hypothetical protein